MERYTVLSDVGRITRDSLLSIYVERGGCTACVWDGMNVCSVFVEDCLHSCNST